MNLMRPDAVYIDEDRTPTRDEAGECECILRLQGGDLGALGELFETYKALVFRVALAITRDERSAEDVLQECFVRLYTYAASVDPQRPLKPWLYRVTVNLSYDCAAKRPVQPLGDMLEWLTNLAGAFPAPDRKAEENETTRMVREVVAELPPTHRTVVVFYYMEGLAIGEIAQILGVPAGTVKSRLHYARERLREMLTRRQRPVPEMAYEFT